MSIVVNLVTSKRVEKKALLENLQGIYAPIYCLDINEDFPTLRFGVFMRSNRGVEVTEIDEGYEVRINVMANKADFDLWRHTIQTLSVLVDAEIYDEDDERVEDIFSIYTDERIDEIIAHDYQMINVMIKYHHGKPVGIFGLLREAHIGNWLLEHLDITDLPAKHAANIFHQWFNELNWDTYIKEKKGTSTQMMLREPDSEESKRVSLYYYEGEDTDYSYISPAELFSIHDAQTDETVLMKYDDLEKIAPNSWKRIDDKQYEVALLDRHEFQSFMKEAKKYAISIL